MISTSLLTLPPKKHWGMIAYISFMGIVGLYLLWQQPLLLSCVGFFGLMGAASWQFIKRSPLVRHIRPWQIMAMVGAVTLVLNYQGYAQALGFQELEKNVIATMPEWDPESITRMFNLCRIFFAFLLITGILAGFYVYQQGHDVRPIVLILVGFFGSLMVADMGTAMLFKGGTTTVLLPPIPLGLLLWR